MWDVILRCYSGALVLRDGPLRWEPVSVVLTWCTCATEQEAWDTVADLLAGQVRGTFAWVTPHGER